MIRRIANYTVTNPKLILLVMGALTAAMLVFAITGTSLKVVLDSMRTSRHTRSTVRNSGE